MPLLVKLMGLVGVCPQYVFMVVPLINLHPHLSLNRWGRWGTTDDFTTSFLHFSLFSTALWNLANPIPVRSLMLFFHLCFCLPCLLPPFTVPYKMVLARSDARETCLHHFSLRLFTMVRSSCGLIACWKKVKVIETHLNM